MIGNSKKDGDKKPKTVRLSEDKKMAKKLNEKKKEMCTDFDVTPHLVIDLGNAMTKIGFSGCDQPAIIVPSIHARNTEQEGNRAELLAFEQKMDIFGYDALDEKYKKGYEILELSPGDHKKKTSENFLEFLKEIFEKQMQITPSDYSAIVNISPVVNPENVDIYLRMFFEEIQLKAIAIVNNASLSLFSTGRTSGMTVQCGETRTYTVPIYEGFPLRHALQKNSVGGKHLTKIFQEGIIQEQYPIRPEDTKLLREIKEKTCSVPYLEPYDYYLNEENNDIIPQEKKLYKLPDDKTIIAIPRKYRIEASELLFT
ncbi:MAG: hypothetical protein MJ252_11205 [archaeon]|nr:hypothetical protein [archaeon]